MKKWLRNSLLAGVFLAGSLGLNAQKFYNSNASKKEIKTELGTNNPSDLVNLGYGYVTLQDFRKYKSKDKYFYIGTVNDKGNFNNLRTLDGINKGSLKCENNGKKIVLYGKTSGEISKETLASVDSDKNYIITPEEISQAVNKKYEESLKNYASKKLGVPKEEVVNVEGGYVTSKELEKSLGILSELYEHRFKHKRKDLYDMMGKDDAVLTMDEIHATAKAIKKFP
jgi:hypothetical protein